MDTFVTRRGTSCALQSRDETGPVDVGAARHFMPVDQYIGGITHAILHCCTPGSSRGLSPTPASARGGARAFRAVSARGMIRLAPGRCSKSKGNGRVPRRLLREGRG